MATNTTTTLQQGYLHNSITIIELHPYYNYKLSVAAFTVALGPFASVVAQTHEAGKLWTLALPLLLVYSPVAPSSAPKNYAITIASPSSVYMTWNAPDYGDQNGIIRHYNIQLVSQNGNTHFYNVSKTIFTLTGLHPYYNYSCTLVAVTVDNGPAITQNFQMPEDGEKYIT